MNKLIFYSTLGLFLEQKCKCDNDLYHTCNITQYELYKNIKYYSYIKILNVEIKKIILDNDSDQEIFEKISYFFGQR